MLIALDARSLLEPITGVGNYTYHLLYHILEQDKQNDYLLLGPPGIRRNLIEARLPKEEKILRLEQVAIGRVKRRSACERLKMFMRYGSIVFFRLNYSLRRANLFFGPNFLGYFSSSTSTVITVHDLSYLIYPDCIAKKTLRFLQKYMPKHLARADRIIAVSKNTKKDLVRLCGVPEEKISVIYSGYNSELFRPVKVEHQVLSDQFDLQPGYILYVGTIEPRKNLVTLLEAYRLLRQRGITAPLVLCGPMGWKSESFFSALRTLKSTNSVRLLGYVDEQWLPLLYNGASCFVFPSLYEGFGFPLLEAMACGCPVVSSGVSAIPEVVGRAGLLIEDPRDQNLLAEAVSRILGDQNLRAELRAEGIKQTSHFSWRKTARETLKIFTDLLEGDR
jgi:glycosyltransferase involved in cell wall biosynthesis